MNGSGTGELLDEVVKKLPDKDISGDLLKIQIDLRSQNCHCRSSQCREIIPCKSSSWY